MKRQVDADLLADAARRGIRYRETILQRRVPPTAEALAALAQLTGPLPESGGDAQEIIERLDRLASPATVANAGGRFFGYVKRWIALRDSRCKLAGHRVGPELRSPRHVAGGGYA